METAFGHEHTHATQQRRADYLPISADERESLSAFGTAAIGSLVLCLLAIAARWLIGG